MNYLRPSFITYEMNFRALYLEPPYSRFFYHLNQVLAPAFYRVLVFDMGNMIYFPTWRSVLVKNRLKLFSPSDDIFEKVLSIPSLLNSKIRKPNPIEATEMAQYYMFLKTYLVDNQITHCFCYNDLRWQHAIAKYVCREVGVEIVFFEEGLFRPDTITFDKLGLNGYAVDSVKPLLRSATDNYVWDLKPMRPSLIQDSLKNLQFGLFLVLSKIGTFFRINTLTRNKKFNFKDYMSLAIARLTAKIRSDKFSDLPAQYIFIPLQVSTDTQTVIHSDFKSTQEVIRVVEEAFYSIPTLQRSAVSLVFKPHPMAVNEKYTFDARSVVTKAPVSHLIEKCMFVITVNSTATIEAIQTRRRAILLGRSIFSLVSMCKKAEHVQDLSAKICELLASSAVTPAEISEANHFLQHLRFGYQLNCNFYNYKSELKAVAKAVI